MEKVFSGRIWTFGNDIDTDTIIPGKRGTIPTIEEMKKYAFELLKPEFGSTVRPGDILVAGSNFGCGSSREHAPIAIKASGIRCVIAASFARIFYRNAINIGLPIVESPEAAREICAGDRLEVDLKRGVIHNLTQSRTYQFGGFPVFIQEMVDAGGLLSYLSQKH